MKSLSLRRTGMLAVAVTGLVLAATGTRADVVFSNFGPGDTFNFDAGYAVAGSSSPFGETIWQAAAFTPSANYTLTEIDLALQHFSGTNGATVELVNSVSGLPGTTVFESWTLTGLPTLASTALGSADMLSSSGPAIQLASGTQYWVVAIPADSTTADAWDVNSTGGAGNFAFSTNGGTTWLPDAIDPTPAFAVLGTPTQVATVPEPPSSLVLRSALVGFGVLIGKRLLPRRGVHC